MGESSLKLFGVDSLLSPPTAAIASIAVEVGGSIRGLGHRLVIRDVAKSRHVEA